MFFKTTLAVAIILAASIGFAFMDTNPGFATFDAETPWPGVAVTEADLNHSSASEIDVLISTRASSNTLTSREERKSVVNNTEPIPYDDGSGRDNVYLCDGTVCYLQ